MCAAIPWRQGAVPFHCLATTGEDLMDEEVIGVGSRILTGSKHRKFVGFHEAFVP